MNKKQSELQFTLHYCVFNKKLKAEAYIAFSSFLTF